VRGVECGVWSVGVRMEACTTRLHFERKVFLEVFNDHDQERKLDAQRLLRVARARDVDGGHLDVGDQG
jgi:phosphotransferase system IIB component